MDYEKVRDDLQEQFNENNLNEDLISRLASAYMETRDFEGAYEILKHGAEQIPCIQTLSNLGYFYLYEGEPYEDRWQYQEEKAISYLEKAVSLNPLSHIPYSVLGEAYLIKNEKDKAEFVLKKAVAMGQTSANLNNLAVALYRQNRYEEAKENFYNSHLKRKSSYYTFRPYLNYGMALAKLGLKKEASAVALELIENQENRFYNICLADIISIYYELNDMNKAAELYPKAFEEIAVLPEYFEMYLYALKQLGQDDFMKKLYKDIVKEEEELIKDIKLDEEIEEDSKEYQINFALDKISKYTISYNKIKNGGKILNNYQPFIEKDCYLFGCLRHKNPTYSEVINASIDKVDFL